MKKLLALNCHMKSGKKRPVTAQDTANSIYLQFLR